MNIVIIEMISNSRLQGGLEPHFLSMLAAPHRLLRGRPVPCFRALRDGRAACCYRVHFAAVAQCLATG
eukprot:13038404-Alexandrium_andersonii.AAC.1